MLKRLLLATALVAPLPAFADTITIGYLDLDIGGGVTPIASASGAYPTVQFLNQPGALIYPLLLGTGFGFDQITALLIPPSQSGLGGTAPTFEFAFNDGFVPPQGGTIRLYATWQGATTNGTPITLPSIFQTNEMPGGVNGLSVSEQIYVCKNGGLFCDDAYVGGGTLVGSTTIVDQLLALGVVSIAAPTSPCGENG